MARIYVLMGKSSTGKDTIFGKIISEGRIDVKPLVLYTTRPIRNGEADGKTYFFTSDEQASLYEKSGKIIEIRAYNTVHGVWKYFTLDDGQTDMKSSQNYIIIGTLKMYNDYVKYFGKDAVCPIYIEVDDKTRLERALERENRQQNPKYAEMCRRFLADEEDFSEDKLSLAGISFESRFVNDDLDECVRRIEKTIESA